MKQKHNSATMSVSRVYLCLTFLTFITSSAVLCSRIPKMAEALSAIEKKHEKEQIHYPALIVSGSPKVDSSSSMIKIDDEPAKNYAIDGFFRYRLPFQGWPFNKYAPFPIVNRANPSVPATPTSGSAEEEPEKVPFSPNRGNRDGGNA